MANLRSKELKSHLFAQLAVLCVTCLVIAIAQGALVTKANLQDSPLWNLPQQFGDTVCIGRVCGWPSIVLIIVAPLAGAIACLLVDYLNKSKLETMRDRQILKPFRNPFYRVQSAGVVALLFSNFVLSGALLVPVFGHQLSFESLIAAQTVLICIAFFSTALANLSGFAASR